MLSIKKRRDVWPCLLTCIIFSMQLTTLILPFFWSMLLACIILFFCGTTAAFQHHHGHCSVFKNKRTNEFLDSILSFQSGITPYAWVLHHNIGHHGNYMSQHPQKGEEIIDASNWSRADGSVMKRWEYVWYNRTRMHTRCTNIGSKAKKIFQKYILFRRIHFVFNAALLVLGFCIGSWQGLISAIIVFAFIPQMMVLFVFETTYDHHSGLFTDNKHEASRNILGSFYNLFRLNLGFHTAHHIKPGLHWSELPQYHASIEQFIPDELLDRSESLIRTIMSNSNKKEHGL